MPELVRTDRVGATVRITLDSPHNRNALSYALLEQLHAALATAAADPGARVVVLTGAGPVFCSGADLKEQRSGTPAGPVGLPDVLLQITDSALPVVARVQGVARAGGLGLIAACDLTVGLSRASFAFSEVRLGLVPAIIAATCLRRMSSTAARELFLTGDAFDGSRAQAVGLLDRAVDDNALDATVDGFVASLVAGAPSALGLVKQIVRDVPGPDLAADLVRLQALTERQFASADAAEGIAAFLDKRRPNWA